MGLLGYSMNDGSAIEIAHQVVGFPQVVPSGEWESQRTIPQMLGVPVELPTKRWEFHWASPEMLGVPFKLGLPILKNSRGQSRLFADYHFLSASMSASPGALKYKETIAYLCKQHYWNSQFFVLTCQ